MWALSTKHIILIDNGETDLVRKADFHDVVCEPGCECPDTKPVLHNGKCMVVEECNSK